ncbi:hypothetical protein PNOK_0835900 [Pyrrhoderma noxium]|uniref:Uncharacterized protein n=1 Tax=Pyrrhoderma noxium TaxID=2282107 RepID=A0A286UAZ7_9AGAM|nr:hypothetical protein PNOK_0835900 [Pyrrhoderma noxium]
MHRFRNIDKLSRSSSKGFIIKPQNDTGHIRTIYSISSVKLASKGIPDSEPVERRMQLNPLSPGTLASASQFIHPSLQSLSPRGSHSVSEEGSDISSYGGTPVSGISRKEKYSHFPILPMSGSSRKERRTPYTLNKNVNWGKRVQSSSSLDAFQPSPTPDITALLHLTSYHDPNRVVMNSKVTAGITGNTKRKLRRSKRILEKRSRGLGPRHL